METNEVMEVEAIEVETNDLMPCAEETFEVADDGRLNLGGVAVLLGGVVGGAAVIVKGSQKVYAKVCNKKNKPIETREKPWQIWRPKAKKVKRASYAPQQESELDDEFWKKADEEA